jgi:hypothetical protein
MHRLNKSSLQLNWRIKMIIKTNNLTGVDLNWAVAKCEGMENQSGMWAGYKWVGIPYSTDWAQGGPIIEGHLIEICHLDNGEWMAQLKAKEWGFHCRHYGESPLIAAMRCYVASKLGNDVGIPKGLV